MANSKGPSSMRHMMYNGKSSLLPPKSPFPSTCPPYVDYLPSSAVTQKGISKCRDGSHHQRTSSESCLIEEQPSWLDDLLNEPETPVRRGGHRRSSSDSFTYFDAANIANLDYIAQDDNKFRNITPVASWGSQDFDYYKDARHATFHVDQNSSNQQKSRSRDASPNAKPHLRGLLPSRENVKTQSLGSSFPPQEGERPKSAGSDKQDLLESVTPDPKGSGEKKDSSHSKSFASENDTKRAKQQFAQRSRVRKLQYISELERNVQVLQAEGSEVSAELEFLNQQSLILSMENKALKQRLENLAQEQMIKHLEHEVLERERGRLRALYQQQQLPQSQQQQQSSSSHRRTTSRDLDQQFDKHLFETQRRFRPTSHVTLIVART
ncbi:PREDICTED: uncharacterized protein At4g06598-like [Nicotiana attenuata]|uniref:uncharacterized protein At4g06598-like n=1 Tax=Nicotiana attenuata TaxID=49451 RepID=UPI0009059F5C|nr:PREDICTED: uncharacterized protein At4g06598-like [Nicotiana attenuata]XP_019229381.1 PREDICTED: uncharacterized protein At4g06598-like [Nicotiana attenuata]XP_019229382.1 PREDICTED: uncharacterized protein At4g06598-like [Nicotiana attenuata]